MIENLVLLDVGECKWARLSKADATKQITWLLDNPTFTWQAKRVADDLETFTIANFTSLRKAAYWCLVENGAIRNAGVSLVDAILLAEHLGLLSCVGTNLTAAELPSYVQWLHVDVKL